MNDSYALDLLGALDQSKSQKQLNSDIKQIEKILNLLQLTATFSKTTPKELNAYIAQLSNQLSTIKLKAEIDSKNIKTDISKALNNVSFKDIDTLNVDESKTKLKLQKVIADAKTYAEKNPISIGINFDSKRSKLDNDLTTYLNRNTKISESSVLMGEANKVRDLIGAITDKKSLREATDAFQLYKSSVASVGYNTQSTTDKIRNMLSHVTKLGSIFSISTLAVNNFTKSLGTLKDIDDILTEISKTSNLTAQELERLGDISFKSASKYGKTASDYLTGIQEMSRSGFYGEKGSAMAEQSLLAQAAGGMTADVANKYILATNAAYKFNGEATKLNAVLDGQNSITNRNSVAMSDMAIAMSEAGTVASSYRVSIEDLSAMIGTMESVTKLGGSEVGNGIKAILINLQNVTSDKIVDTLDAANASMTEFVNGTEKLRDPISILRDLAKTFNQLDEDDALRAEILTNIGGKHQASKLAALLQNMELFDKMLVDYAEGSGSAMEEAMKSANNWSGKLNQLQNSWDSLVASITNKNAVLNGLTFGDKLIQGIEGLIEKFGVIPTILTAINSSMVAMQKDYGITQIINPETKKLDVQGNIFGIVDFTAIKNQKKHFEEAGEAILHWNDKLSSGKADIESFNSTLVLNNASLKEYLSTCSKDAPASLSGYKQYLQSTGQATENLRLKTILLNTALTFLGGIAVQAVITGIAKAFDKFNETVEESQEKVNDINSKISDLKTQIEELNSLEYKSDFDKQKISQLERELELQEKILEVEQKRLYQNQIGTKFSDYFDANSLVTKQHTEDDRYNKEGYTYLSVRFEADKESLADIEAELASLQDRLATGLSGHERFEVEGKIEKLTEKRNSLLEEQQTIEEQLTLNMASYLENYQTAQEAVESGLLTGSDLEKAESMAEYWNQMYQDSNDIVTNIQKMNGTYDNTIDLLEEMFGSISRDDLALLSDDDKRIALSFDPDNIIGFEELQQKIAETKDDIEELNGTKISTFDQAWADSFTSESDAVKELGNNLLELAEKGRLTKEAFNEVDSNAGDYFKNLGISAEEAVSKINALVDESKQLSSMASQISSISDALSTKLSDGFVSVDTLSGFDVEVRGLESWDRFQEVLGSTTSSYEECQEAANALATEWVNDSNFLEQLTEQNKEYYETQLQAMGVENYEEVIAYAQQLNVAKEALTQASFDVATATVEEIQAFINESVYSELAQQEIWNLILAKQTEEGITLDTSADCQNLLALAQNAGVTGDAITLLTQLLEIYNNLAAGTYGTNAQVINAVKNKAESLKSQINDIFANGASRDTVELNPKIKVSPSTKSSAKSAGKETGDAYKDGLKEALSDIESVISGVTKALDRQISSINAEKSAALSSIDEQKESIESAKDAAIEALEQERQKRLDVIETQRKQIEQNIKAKEKIIQQINDEIKAMRDANDERNRQLTLQEKQIALERLQNQHTILQYSEERGMHYVTNTKDIRAAKQAVDDAKLEIEIANKEKEISLIEKEISLLNEKLDLLSEQEAEINDYYDKLISETERFYDSQLKNLEKQRKEVSNYYDSLTKSLEDQKNKFQELTELLEKAELSAKLKQLGIDEEALLNGSEEEFEKLKQAYLDIVYALNEGNDDVLSKLRELSGYDGKAPTLLSDSNTELDTMNGNLDTANQSVGNVNSSLSETASTTSDVASNVNDMSSSLTEATAFISEEETAFNNLKSKIDEVIEAINQKTEAIQAEQEAVGIATSSEMADFLLLKEKILEVKETLESFGTPEEGLIHNITAAIESLNEISLEDGIIGQFTQLKEAVDAVASAIIGGGDESSGSEGQGGNSGSSGGESGGKGSKGEGGGGNSLTGAIEQMGETANTVIGEPDAEGDGTVIGAFGSLETAVNDVTSAIGGGDSEGGQGSGSEDEGNLIGSIVNLGETSEETLGEPDGDGIIGKFNEFKGVIEEAANQVKSISDGLDEIDGKEVECTITVNVKMNGSIPAFASGTVLGNMQIESASYNAQYGKAFASGTIGLPHAEKNALVSEYGQTEMTVLPDGKTIITDTPTMMDLPKDTVIFNEKETKKIMDNKVDVSGTAHADGTAHVNGTANDDAPRYPSQETLDFMERMKKLEMQHELIANYTYGVLSPLHEIKQNTENMVSNISNVNNVNNKNVQQPVTVNQNITVSCPNVTNNSGVEYLEREFNGLHLKAYQASLEDY